MVEELSFNQGMLLFSHDSFEMHPCLPEHVEPRVQSFYIGGYGLTETTHSEFEDIEGRRDSGTQSWLHVSGKLDEQFWEGLHRCLQLTDEQVKLLKSPHRGAFFEDFPNGLFWTLQRPSIVENAEAIETVNFFLSKSVLVTRQFSDETLFSSAIHKLMARGDRIEHMTVDLLAEELIDNLLDSYVQSLKFGGTKLEDIQNKIIRNPGKSELNLINRAQQIIWIYLNAMWPVETVLHQMARSRNPVLTVVGREELTYRQEQAAAVVRLFETYRQMSYNLMDVYVSGIGLRTNETTALLTIIATLFLPPTLIAGIYGMNFNIPEYHVQNGYYLCLAVMFVVSGGMLAWLKWKGFIQF
jgi:magnesium transporter